MNAPTPIASQRAHGDASILSAAFVREPSLSEMLKSLFEDKNWSRNAVNRGDITTAVHSISADSCPSLLFVELAPDGDATEHVRTLHETTGGNTAIIGIGLKNDVGYYRSLINAGLFDYLVTPVNSEVVTDAAESALTALEATRSPEIRGHHTGVCDIITFIGVRGGVGASTLATNFAWLAPRHYEKRAALLDLDLHFGTSALTFDLEPGQGLSDALSHPDRVDSLFLDRATVKESTSLSILAAETALTEAALPRGESYASLAVDRILEELSSSYRIMAVDCPRYALQNFDEVVKQSAKVVLVADLTLSAVRDVIRLNGLLADQLEVSERLLVVNHVRDRSEVSVRDFEVATELSIDLIVPYDPKTAIASAKAAKVMYQYNKHSKASQALLKLTEKLVGVAPAKKTSGLLGNLAGLMPKSPQKKAA